MEAFEAALTEATARCEAAQEARQREARLSKDADARGDEAARARHFNEAQKHQNEAIAYAAAITALRTIIRK